MPEVYLTQRTREITGITFLSGNVEINAINITAVADSILYLFLKVLVKSNFDPP